jgi:hypothetical protein
MTAFVDMICVSNVSEEHAATILNQSKWDNDKVRLYRQQKDSSHSESQDGCLG